MFCAKIIKRESDISLMLKEHTTTIVFLKGWNLSPVQSLDSAVDLQEVPRKGEKFESYHACASKIHSVGKSTGQMTRLLQQADFFKN